MEAIVLAGGFGTRLSNIVFDVPKPMAEVSGKPFLQYLFDYLYDNHIDKIILAIGYKSEIILDYFGESYRNIKLIYSKEETPLGTGGAIKRALKLCTENDVFIVNGDTYFDVNLRLMKEFHESRNSQLTIAVKSMNDFERYGSVIIKDEYITKFEEKRPTKVGKINGGTYIINKNIMNDLIETSFSFEKVVLESYQKKIFVFESDGYFIDIGIPEDYHKAQNIFKLQG